MRRPPRELFLSPSLPMKRALSLAGGGVGTLRLPSSGPAMRAFAGLTCTLALLIPQAFAGQPNMPDARTRQPVGRGPETSSPAPLHPHRIVGITGGAKEPGTTARAPYIRPIAPMPPLFTKDDLLRIPWTSFGFHRTPVHFHSRPPVAVRTFRLRPWVGQPSTPPPSMVSADMVSSLARLVSEHIMPTVPRLSAGAAEPLSSNTVPQTGISPERAAQIQAALVRSGYLAGAPTGTWDAASVVAMRRLQSDHRWQTKFMPDARALIFLGLGPGSETP